MSKFCDKCGLPLKPNENFCTNCGAKIIRDESPSTPPDKPKSESKSPSTKVICIGLAVAVSVIFIVAMFVNRSISDTNVSHKPAPVEQPKTQSATVPDVVGKNQSDAVAALTAAGIEAKISDSYSADVPIGKIISQTPNPGANIARGQTVYLYVSKGVDPGKTSEPLTEADFTLGGLTLGMSKAEVKMKYGNPSNDGDDYFNYGNIEVGFANGLVKTVACTGSNATSRGIVIGASLADIERVYGKNYSRDKDASGDIYTYKFGDSSLRFVLDERSGKITRIAVYKSTPKPSPPPAPKPASDGYNYSCTVNGTTTYKGIKRNGIACALYDYQTQKQISSEYFSKTARGTFYIVTAIVGNGTNAPIVYPTLYLVDERDRKYSSNNDATSIYNTIHNVEVELELNPGQPQFVYEVYDIPDGVNITGLRCEAFTADFDAVEFNLPFRVVTE